MIHVHNCSESTFIQSRDPRTRSNHLVQWPTGPGPWMPDSKLTFVFDLNIEFIFFNKSLKKVMMIFDCNFYYTIFLVRKRVADEEFPNSSIM